MQFTWKSVEFCWQSVAVSGSQLAVSSSTEFHLIRATMSFIFADALPQNCLLLLTVIEAVLKIKLSKHTTEHNK